LINIINMKKKQTLKQDLILFFWSLVSGFILSLALVTFFTPAKLYPGGITGISRIVVDICADYLDIQIPFGLIYAPLNLILCLFTFKVIGKRFAIFSAIQFLSVSIFTSFLQPIIVVDDLLLMSVFGGVISGFATSLALNHNSSGGGTDFVAIYISNKYKKNAWSYIMILNVLILSIAGLIYGWQRALYSIILQFCSMQVVNHMHKRYSSETLIIVTSKPDEIANAIFDCVRHGITELDARGSFKHQGKKMMMTVVHTYETPAVVQAILKVDEEAFINILTTNRVVGNYFQEPLA